MKIKGKPRVPSKQEEDKFAHLCGLLDNLLMDFGMQGVYAAFSVGTVLAHDMGLSSEEVQELQTCIRNELYLGKASKINSLDKAHKIYKDLGDDDGPK